MGITYPWMLLGLATLAVPVLVHLVARESERGRVFPSLMFLSRATYRIRQRRRLRDPWLLLLRLLIILVLVAAFAHIEWPRWVPNAGQSAIDKETVFLIDRSYSMSPPVRWSQAVDSLVERIEGLTTSEAASLVAFDRHAEILTPPTNDPDALLNRARALTPGVLDTSFAAALDAASRQLSESEARQRRIVLVSDLQRSAIEKSGALALPDDVELEIVPVAEPVGANLTVTGVDLIDAPRISSGDTLVVQLRNTGGTDLTDGSLTLTLDGTATDERDLALKAGQTGKAEFSVVLARGRPTRITLTNGTDALSADDRYLAVLTARPPLEAVLVERAPGDRNGSLFIREALRLLPSPGVRFTTVSAAALPERLDAGPDLVIIEDAAALPAATEEALAGFVQRGGGLMITAGPGAGLQTVRSESGLFPTLGPPAPTPDDSGAQLTALPGQDAFWSRYRLRGPRLFAGMRAGMFRPLDTAPSDEVLLTLGNGEPLLTVRQHGEGRVAVLGTTADPRWGTLAIEPGFVPMMQALAAFLSDRDNPVNAYRVGESATLVANAAIDRPTWRQALDQGQPLTVETPESEAVTLPVGSDLFVPEMPGFYELHSPDQAVSLAFAANVDREESRLQSATPAELTARLVRQPRDVVEGDLSAGETTDDGLRSAHWLFVLAFSLILLETILFRSRVGRRSTLTQNEESEVPA